MEMMATRKFAGRRDALPANGALAVVVVPLKLVREVDEWATGLHQVQDATVVGVPAQAHHQLSV